LGGELHGAMKPRAAGPVRFGMADADRPGGWPLTVRKRRRAEPLNQPP
jgi:hypothetical protein